MPRPRPAYTLFELVLVLAILIAVAAIGIPVIDSMMADHRVTAARDMIRARLADARGLAMKEGRPYKFTLNPNTGQFTIEPEESTPKVQVLQLPEQVLFCKSADALMGQTAPSAGSGFETAVIYLADGTAREDLPNTIMFALMGTRATALCVRPLTGAVSNHDPATGEDQP